MQRHIADIAPCSKVLFTFLRKLVQTQRKTVLVRHTMRPKMHPGRCMANSQHCRLMLLQCFSQPFVVVRYELQTDRQPRPLYAVLPYLRPDLY